MFLFFFSYPKPGHHGSHTVSAAGTPVEQFCQLCGVGVGNDMLLQLSLMSHDRQTLKLNRAY